MEGFGLIGTNWHQMHMEKIWKRFHEIKYWKQWTQRILCNIFDLACSIHIQAHNPKPGRLQAAPQEAIAYWNFSQKLKHWKPVSSSIQTPILVLSSSWDITERFLININHQNALNWYQESGLYLEIFEIAQHDSIIFLHFSLLIHVHIDVSKLTITFNCIVSLCIRFHHWQILGFQGSKIGALCKA